MNRRADQQRAGKPCQHRAGEPAQRHAPPIVLCMIETVRFDRRLMAEIERPPMAFGAEFGGRGGWRQSAGSIGWATASQSLPEPNPIVSRAGQRRRKALNVAAMRRDGALPHCGKTACGAKKFHVGVDTSGGGLYRIHRRRRCEGLRRARLVFLGIS
jgi:hypothetical protein